MTTYEPGIVAIATVRGVPNMRVMRVEHGHFPWSGADGHRHYDDEVTDIRPLVVLDLTEYGREAILAALRSHSPASRFHTNDWLADQIEAQTKPVRIPEPGPWGVVTDKDGYYWTRDLNGSFLRWVAVDNDAPGMTRRKWDELDAPLTLVRPGIEDES